jgi:hypothetical protein
MIYPKKCVNSGKKINKTDQHHALIYNKRLQGTCFKGDACEFSHVIDFQQVADKIISPPSTSALTIQNEAPVDFNQGDYPELIPSSLKTKPVTIKSGPTISTTPTTKEQDFPSLSEAASIRSKSKINNNNNNNNNKQVINFAAVASKNKDQPIKKKNKLPAGKNKSHYASIQKLKKPVQIPWLETGSSLHSVYMKEVRKNNVLTIIIIIYKFTEKTGD